MLFITDKIMYKIIINGIAEKLKINKSNIEVATKVILNILILVNKFSFFEILNEKNGILEISKNDIIIAIKVRIFWFRKNGKISVFIKGKEAISIPVIGVGSPIKLVFWFESILNLAKRYADRTGMINETKGLNIFILSKISPFLIKFRKNSKEYIE